MKYIRTKDGIFRYKLMDRNEYNFRVATGNIIPGKKIEEEVKIADTIEELCDCFIKIKRKKDYRDYILKFDFRDLQLLKEQRIKYPSSPVYGAIHIEDKGLIYVAKMNDKGELELI